HVYTRQVAERLRRAYISSRKRLGLRESGEKLFFGFRKLRVGAGVTPSVKIFLVHSGRIGFAARFHMPFPLICLSPHGWRCGSENGNQCKCQRNSGGRRMGRHENSSFLLTTARAPTAKSQWLFCAASSDTGIANRSSVTSG